MKKLFQGLYSLLLFFILTLSAFSTLPQTNADFSHVKNHPIQAVAHHTAQPTAQITTKATTYTTDQPTAQAILPLPGDYACILSDDVFFYANADGRKGLFLLPQSYYVRLLEYHTDYCKVEYQTDADAKRLVGYVATEKLTFVEYTHSRPYLYYVFDLRYKIEDTDHVDSAFLTEITISCIYYGDYVIGSERYCYVLRGEEFGYVPKPITLVYEDNEEYADYVASLLPPTEPEVEQEEETSNIEKNSPAQIAILVAICLLVPILAALLLKPS